jgi:hypothetical protein
MSKPTAILLWCRLDIPGHDSCCLFMCAAGWRLIGVSVQREIGLRLGSVRVSWSYSGCRTLEGGFPPSTHGLQTAEHTEVSHVRHRPYT